MKKLFYLTVALILTLVFAQQLRHLYFRYELNHKISVNNVSSIEIWGTGLPEGRRTATKEEAEKIVKWFNSADDFRENKEFAGTTPDAGIRIRLKTLREEISILRSGEDFEIQRGVLRRISYWAKQPELRNFLIQLSGVNKVRYSENNTWEKLRERKSGLYRPNDRSESVME